MQRDNKKGDNKADRKWLIKNILFALLGALIFVFLLFRMLGLVTRHGKTIEVPNIIGLSLDDAKKVAKKSNVRVYITDSVYIPKMKKGSIFKQVPEAGATVKKNRRILVTINSFIPQKSKVPNVIGLSLRQAQSTIESQGLKIGKLIYVSDIATNSVLGQKHNGKSIAPGKELPIESEIDLEIGLNESDCMTRIPNLNGLPYSSVKNELTYYSLNLGRMIFDGSVANYSDTLSAIVYKQSPAPTNGLSVRMGTPVTVYLSKNKSINSID